MKKVTNKKKLTFQQRFQRLNKEIKAFIAISVFVFIAILAGIFFLNSNSLLQADQSSAQTAVGRCQTTRMDRICWNGKEWFLLGANYAWQWYGDDIGSPTRGYAAQPGRLSETRNHFAQMRDAGMKNVRFWMYSRNAEVTDSVINATVADINKLMPLIEEYDLYIHFVFFNDAYWENGSPGWKNSYIDTPAKRTALVDKLRRVVTASNFSKHPRIMSWELTNEIRYDNLNNPDMVAFIQEYSAMINSSTHSYSHFSHGLDQISTINSKGDLGIGFYQPHHYVYYGNSHRCTDYNGTCLAFERDKSNNVVDLTYSQIAQKYGANKPIVVGEIDLRRDVDNYKSQWSPGGSYTGDFDAYFMLNEMFNHGIAGVWPWSVNYGATNDQFQIDYADVKRFANEKGCIIGPTSNPACGGVNPNPGVSTAPSPISASSPSSNPSPQSPIPVSNNCRGSSNRICWRGEESFMLGVNMAWYNWAQDFSGGSNGVANTKSQLEGRFRTLQENKIKNVRWWMFQGENIGQITRDSSGLPTGFNQNIYRDIDAALELARKYDLYYHFTLFSTAMGLPSNWIDNATGRERLATALAPLFARYKDEPRIVSWESFNEPEIATVNQGWGTDSQGNYLIVNNPTGQRNIALAANEIAKAVHNATRRADGSTTLSSVGQYYATAMQLYNNTEIDFHQPHFYDNYGHTRNRDLCLVCRDYNGWKSALNITKPIVVGEWYGNTHNNVTAYQRLNEFRDKGFAGAWAWSLWWDRTNDRFQVNFADFKRFAEENACIMGPGISGPNCPGTNPPVSVAPSQASSTNPSVAASPQPSSQPSSNPNPQPSLSIPGRIEAEAFNNTGNNSGYYDTTSGNTGGAYLPNTDVDIQRTTDSAGGDYNVGWTAPGEWLTYTFTARESGQYKIQTRAGNLMPGGRFELLINGQSLGEQSVPGTSGWQNFQTVESSTFSLNSGTNTLRINMKTNAWSNAVGNFNYFEFVKVSGSTQPSTTPAIPQASASIVPTNSGSGTLWKAINLNGRTLTADGILFQSEAQSGVTYRTYSKLNNQSISLNGSISPEKAEMIRSSIWGSGGCCYEFPRVTVPNIPNGNYDIYAYIWEDNYNEKLQLVVEGKVVKSDINSGRAGDWQKLGPYRTSVSDGKLEVGFFGGNANFSGLEIWKVQ